MVRLRWKDFGGNSVLCHFARPHINWALAQEMHTHDFLEAFWIESGRGWHWINGEKRPLHAGGLVLIRAADHHAFSSIDSGGFRMVNVAFSTQLWRGLVARYGGEMIDLFAGVEIAEREYTLTGTSWSGLGRAAGAVAGGARGQLAVEQFLLNLYALLIELRATPAVPGLPDWLAFACRQIALPQHFRAGAPELARLAGRSAEHTARACRRYLSLTPTDVVNQARMQFAGSRLADSNDAIIEVAMDCGLENLGHFYKLFERHFQQTPADYRRRQQRVIRPQSGG